jgi:hypothetical protein
MFEVTFVLSIAKKKINLDVASKRLFLRMEVELAKYPTGRVSL